MDDRLNAYFHSRLEALLTAQSLPTYQVSDPQPVVPRNGRSWLLEITLPETYDPIPPEVMAHIETIVWRHDGEIHQTEV